MDHEQRVECAKEFDRIWEAIQPMQTVQSEQGKLLAKVETNTLHLIESVKGLTAALWGLVCLAGAAGLAFILGRI